MYAEKKHNVSVELLKSEAFTGFVCTTCGCTFPIPPANNNPSFEQALSDLIGRVNAHCCASPAGAPQVLREYHDGAGKESSALE